MSLKEELHVRRPFSSIQEEALLSLSVTWDLLFRNLQVLMRRHGLSLAQYNVLRILRGAGHEGIPLMEIARRMIVRYPNVTRLTDRLEAEGLIRRERSSTDRRVVRAFATSRALEILAKLDTEVEETNVHLMRGADVEDLQRLIAILSAVREPLRNGNGVLPADVDDDETPCENGDDPDRD